MTNWNKIFSTGNMAQDVMRNFAEGKMSCETVQRCFRNVYPEASSELRAVIRSQGTKRTRELARKALRRRGLV